MIALSSLLAPLVATKLRVLLLAGGGLAAAGGGLVASWSARDPLPGPVQATVVRVIDGDTMAVRARIWIGQEVETTVRIFGIDAPELNGKCDDERIRAAQARDFLLARTDNRTIVMHDIRNDKYGGRVIARVATESGEDLGAALLAQGLAAAYDGRGARPRWC